MKSLRALAVALGILLTAGACGGASSSGTTTAATDVTADLDEPATTDTGDADEPAAVDDPPAANDSAPADDPPAADEPAPADDSTAEASDAPAVSVLPDVEVVDLATGETINLTAFAPADRPIVLWFWAPH